MLSGQNVGMRYVFLLLAADHLMTFIGPPHLGQRQRSGQSSVEQACCCSACGADRNRHQRVTQKRARVTTCNLHSPQVTANQQVRPGR
jgi:hypothetical protein